MLHMDVIEERIEREFNINLIATSPSVIYEVTLTDGNIVMVENPTKLPDRTIIKEINEPYIKTSILYQMNLLVLLWNCVKIKEVHL